MSASNSSSNWIRPNLTHCFCDQPIPERTSRTAANPARRFLCCLYPSDSRRQCKFYFFLDPELRYGYYREEMHRLYLQVQEQMREMQVQEYTLRAIIHELELEVNKRETTDECYKKAIIVFTLVVFLMFFLTN
nr:quinoprotein amine dehydrogenase, beta chain-like protein [Tanacetum cinerariifolium]